MEIDKNCDTLKEGELYLGYLLKKLELKQANLTIEEYKESIKKKDSLIIDHRDLISKIEALVSKTI